MDGNFKDQLLKAQMIWALVLIIGCIGSLAGIIWIGVGTTVGIWVPCSVVVFLVMIAVGYFNGGQVRPAAKGETPGLR